MRTLQTVTTIALILLGLALRPTPSATAGAGDTFRARGDEPLCPAVGGWRDCNDDVHLTTNEVSRQLWQSIILIFRPAVFDRDVSTFNVASFT